MNATTEGRTDTDIAVIGGGPAGLQAALTIGRVHRRVSLFDDGRYRNATVAHMHNVVTHDGTPPAQFRANGRAELAAYGTVQVREERVERVAVRHGGGFTLTTADGSELSAAAVVLATGLRDELPAVEGLDALWGDLVAACPFCHGHEAAGRRVGILGAAAAPPPVAASSARSPGRSSSCPTRRTRPTGCPPTSRWHPAGSCAPTVRATRSSSRSTTAARSGWRRCSSPPGSPSPPRSPSSSGSSSTRRAASGSTSWGGPACPGSRPEATSPTTRPCRCRWCRWSRRWPAASSRPPAPSWACSPAAH